MRTLDELGISPAPWRTYGDGEVYMAGGVNPVCVVGNLCDERREASLARFIAAARCARRLRPSRDRRREMTNDIITLAAIAVSLAIGAVLAVCGSSAKGGR